MLDSKYLKANLHSLRKFPKFALYVLICPISAMEWNYFHKSGRGPYKDFLASLVKIHRMVKEEMFL